jgi:hypothetical protein
MVLINIVSLLKSDFLWFGASFGGNEFFQISDCIIRTTLDSVFLPQSVINHNFYHFRSCCRYLFEFVRLIRFKLLLELFWFFQLFIILITFEFFLSKCYLIFSILRSFSIVLLLFKIFLFFLMLFLFRVLFRFVLILL